MQDEEREIDPENQDDNNENDEIQDLRLENEIKKMKLSLEHGTDFSLPDSKDVPPEIESVWLDYIQQFEDQFSQNKRISVYDFIGKPDFKKQDEISDDNIEAELDHLIEIMNKYNVVVDTICDVDDRELYRFITEELFAQETNDIRIEGMKHYFIYEEFHPNHEYDIKNHCMDFINSVLDKEKDWMPDFIGLAEHIESVNGPISRKDAVRKIEVFREAFSGFDQEECNITLVSIDNAVERAILFFNIHYTAYIEGSNDTIPFGGDGSLSLIMDHGYWCINKIDFPGLVI